MLRILGRTSSINVRKALWTADELGIPYEHEARWGTPDGDLQSPEFLAFNPNAQVPVIIEGDFVLHESSAIMLYLAGRSDGLLPGNAEQRALSHQWLMWQATELNPSWGYAVAALIRKRPGYDDPAKIADALRAWGGKMRILDEQLRKTSNAAGDEFTLADIALGLSIHRWYAVPEKLPEFANIRRYYDALRDRPAGARYLAAEFV